MPAVVKEVECSLEDFSDHELTDEIRYRGLEYEFTDTSTPDDFSDKDLIDELTDRGYTVSGKQDKPINNLFTTYLTMSPEFFKKELEKFFIDNGFRP